MRVANLGLLAVLLLSAAYADDQVIPPAASNAEQAAAASADPTVRAEPVSEPARDEHSEAAPDAVRQGSEKTPDAAASERHPEPAIAGAAPNAPETSEKAAKDDEVPLDTKMRRLGFTPKVIDGETRYCKETAVLGSRLNKKTICWTTEQIRNHQESVDEVREKQGRRETYPRP
jgi:hypothetical protein